ncbi:ankyrin repeat protein, putative [Trichomonas vaginalis G3]|uniref:Ankyrin repeat protein, putative n=1 Tax=Trichomonas vaginalis (strain ATCC PRA-98 / G3) TaxID=412133 RepID=A2E1G8_TRIV3|nr:spectrin binding [Trichomonas vaginalis G3]EAY13535.1 ankyrin repeat protein, putative [Trichomonas vaginalis G3]KAI5529189.1 spectrin binding [Trichomonas vaginalis G3]|eukprot:XP_001325758.1 ankyrin repeat protein [Trichomonas vaginalis G3]
MIKNNLIDSKATSPENILKHILDTIAFNNRYLKSYLALAKLIYDEYHVKDVSDVGIIPRYLFYKEYRINLGAYDISAMMNLNYLDPLSENTIYRAIMDNDKERFISFTERDGFNKDQNLESYLYPNSNKGYSLLELCCYYGAVDCFKFLITKYNPEITKRCLELSFLGGNPGIVNECLKYQEPDEKCMEYAILSHNIDFVTFLMNEYNLRINLDHCAKYNNLESLLVHFDQTNNIYNCFLYSTIFDIPSLCIYFASLGTYLDGRNIYGETALHYAASHNYIEVAEFLLSHGADINAKNNCGETALHCSASHNYIEIAEFLLSHGANINAKNYNGETALHIAAYYNYTETLELLISHGANINEKEGYDGKTALHRAVITNNKEAVKILISHGANINEKDEYAMTALHYAAMYGNGAIAMFLRSYGASLTS